MHSLCSEGANACFIDGQLELMESLIREVIKNAVSVEDKFRATEIKILAEQAAGNNTNAISLALQLRKELGLTAMQNKPVSSLILLKEYHRTCRMLKNMSAQDIAALPELTDKRYIMGQRLCEMLLTSAYQAQPTLYTINSFLLVRTTLKHGINSSSCDAFSSFGVVLW